MSQRIWNTRHLSLQQTFIYLFLLSPKRECAVLCLVAQLCPNFLCDLMDCSCQTPLSMGFLQARILEWVAISSSRGSWKKCYLHILSPTIVWYVSENMTHKALESSGKIYRFMSFIFQYRIYSLKNRDWHHSYLNSWQKSIDLLIRGGQVKKLQCKNPSQK